MFKDEYGEFLNKEIRVAWVINVWTVPEIDILLPPFTVYSICDFYII